MIRVSIDQDKNKIKDHVKAKGLTKIEHYSETSLTVANNINAWINMHLCYFHFLSIRNFNRSTKAIRKAIQRVR